MKASCYCGEIMKPWDPAGILTLTQVTCEECLDQEKEEKLAKPPEELDTEV